MPGGNFCSEFTVCKLTLDLNFSSDANLTVDLTFDTDVKCKCNGACTNFKWFKNGLIMYNDTNLNNKSDEAKKKRGFFSKS